MLSSVRLLLAAMIGLFAFAAPGMAATPIGKVIAAVGSPTSSGRPLRNGSPVYENDRLQTGGGNIQILFIDNTKLVVGPNSTLVLDRFLMRGGNRAQKFSVDALRGTFRFISGNSAKNAYDIQTANATIGIRGTGFDFTSGRTTVVAVHDGLVRLCAFGRCDAIPENCGVGRARSGRVDELEGRAKGQALSELPYILNQAALARPFRLNTRSCRASLDIFENRRNNSGGGGPGGTRSAPDTVGGGEEGGQVD